MNLGKGDGLSRLISDNAGAQRMIPTLAPKVFRHYLQWAVRSIDIGPISEPWGKSDYHPLSALCGVFFLSRGRFAFKEKVCLRVQGPK